MWHIIRANILVIVNVILTDEIGMFLNTLLENLEANCKIIIFGGGGGIINNYWTRLSKISRFVCGEQINYSASANN